MSLLLLAEEAASKVFGLTVAEWSVLLAALVAFVGAVRENLAKRRNASKVDAVIDAIEDLTEHHPEAAKLAKQKVRAKATSLGVEIGDYGLMEDVKRRNTIRFKKGGV